MEFEIRFRRRHDRPFSDDTISRHVQGLTNLDEQGRLIAAGPLEDGTGGLILARFDSLADAQGYAERDAFVVDGYETVEVRRWLWAHRGNDYLADRGDQATDERTFVPLPLDKHDWHPSPLPGQIVLVSTFDTDRTLDVAAKSWVSMAAFNGPIIGFGCNESHQTSRNIVANGEFVINIPDTRLASTVWDTLATHGAERVARSGLTFRPATVVDVPVVADCVAHLECRHSHTATFDDGEVFIFGTIVAASIDARCVTDNATVCYHRLDPLFFLENQLYAPLGRPGTPRAQPAGKAGDA